MVLEKQPFLSETIDMRGLQVRMSHAAQSIRTLVIGEDENDVGAFGETNGGERQQDEERKEGSHGRKPGNQKP